MYVKRIRNDCGNNDLSLQRSQADREYSKTINNNMFRLDTVVHDKMYSKIGHILTNYGVAVNKGVRTSGHTDF